jgi:hypothetical protein
MGMHFPLYLGPSGEFLQAYLTNVNGLLRVDISHLLLTSVYIPGSNSFHPESNEAWFLSTSSGVTFSDIAHASTPFDAIGMVPAAGWLQILVAAGAFELTAWNRQWNEDRPVAGDYGYDPLGFTKRAGGLDSPELKELRIQEIKNGRLAM